MKTEQYKYWSVYKRVGATTYLVGNGKTRKECKDKFGNGHSFVKNHTTSLIGYKALFN